MLTAKMRGAIEDAIEISHFTKSFVSLREVAEDVYDSNPELMEQAKRPILVDKIKRMIKAHRFDSWSKSKRSSDSQLALPGFEDVPRRIFLPNGRRKLLDEATAYDIRKHLGILRARALARPKIIRQMEHLLELIQKHNAKNPRMTWAKVKAIELQGF